MKSSKILVVASLLALISACTSSAHKISNKNSNEISKNETIEEIHFFISTKRLAEFGDKNRNHQLQQVATLLKKGKSWGITKKNNFISYIIYGLRYGQDYDKDPDIHRLLSEFHEDQGDLINKYIFVEESVWKRLKSIKNTQERQTTQIGPNNPELTSKKNENHVGILAVNYSGSDISTFFIQSDDSALIAFPAPIRSQAGGGSGVAMRCCYSIPKVGENILISWFDSSSNFEVRNKQWVEIRGKTSNGSEQFENFIIRFLPDGRAQAEYIPPDAFLMKDDRIDKPLIPFLDDKNKN